MLDLDPLSDTALQRREQLPQAMQVQLVQHLNHRVPGILPFQSVKKRGVKPGGVKPGKVSLLKKKKK